MSKELKAYGLATGLNLYAVITNSAGLVWTGSGNNFAAASGITWSASGVLCPPDATLTRNYAGDFPTAITSAGVYTIEFFPRSGGSLVVGDVTVVPLSAGTIDWSGAAEVTSLAGNWLVNVQNTAASLVFNLTGNISGSVSSVSALGAGAKTDVQAAMTSQGYTTTRAGYLDNISSGIGSGIGNVSVTHNTTATDAFRVLDTNAQPISGATINAYLTSVYTAGTAGPSTDLGQTTTAADGRWAKPIMFTAPNSGTIGITLVFSLPGVKQPSTTTITIDSSGTVTTP